MTPDALRAAEWDCTRLVHLYANLVDQARWAEVAALYVADGRMTRPTAPDLPVVGRDAILAAFEARPPRVTRHICSNVVIELVSDRSARGNSAMLLFSAADKPPLVGGFEDSFVRVDEGWRFAERRGTLTF
ncbi:nuclear transport factor 2 family protein [Sphingomonas sp. PB4P5]|uniref:nuclear transport factor 2 family protein n=1 Tax=Parasphingomonas puruogangriensis TaxID=3096155 RepID=UPI002FC74DD5